MKKEKLTECLNLLFNSLVENESKESLKLVIEALEKLKQSEIDVSNPENFNHFLVYKLNKGLREIAKTVHIAPQDDIKDKSKPNFIYLHYDFLEHSIRELCELREGSCCCADKSRFILNMYLKYSLTGKIPEFNPEVEHFWTPKFGTYEEWINLCDGLYSLYYGKTEKYFRSYNSLIQSEIRKYKHILHTWYIKFKDGDIVDFAKTWDDKVENPLDNEFCNKGEYYLIYKKFVKNKKYEKCSGSNDRFIDNQYYKVPKILFCFSIIQ